MGRKSNYRGKRSIGFLTGHFDNTVDRNMLLEPLASFDTYTERYCCTDCGYQTETKRGMEAHLAKYSYSTHKTGQK